MLKQDGTNLEQQDSEKKIAAVEFSPLILPGKLFFGLYNNSGMKIEGGFEVDDFILSKHLPLVSQEFADKAVVIEDFKLAFEHDISGTSDLQGNDQFVLELTLVLDGNKVSQLKLPLSGSTAKMPANPPFNTPGGTNLVANPRSNNKPTNVPPGSIFWINIQKSIGPIHVEKIGFNCIGDDVQVLLNASLSTSSLSIELSGLSVTVPIFGLNSIDDLEMELKGLDIAFSTPALTIEGGLLRNNVNGMEEYDGALTIKTEDFSMTALGSYTKMKVGSHTDSSLFAFAFLDDNIGGPPCFFVTGLSAGFGYNRSVKVPSLAQVSTFPLLSGLNNPSELGLSGSELPAASELSDVVSKMESNIQPALGEYWFAAGVQFISFELIHSNVVVILEVGKEFEILILGKSYASFPPIGKKYGYVELDIEVVLQPDRGIFKTEAVLSSNSYVLDPNCHLTGGFAFYTWFGRNPHAGDFVFTIGGYYPSFNPPAYYPVVDKLGFNWPVSGSVSIKGGAYFALTPSCIMAGGSLETLYHSGNLRAWFTAYADLLIYWKPFYFTADIGVDVGVSYHVHFLFVSKTLKLEVGANINLYGPPTGGKAHVHLWIVSFTVSFGASESAGDAQLDWTQFKTMLSKPRKDDSQNTVMMFAEAPSTNNDVDVCHVTVSDGLLNQVKDTDGSVRWLVRADEFTFDVTSGIPMTQVDFHGTSAQSKSDPLAIRPMKIDSIISSVGTVTVQSEDGNSMTWNRTQGYLRDLPQAIWGTPVDYPSNINPNEKLIHDCLIGLKSISPVSDYQPNRTGQIDVAKAFTYFLLYPDGSNKLPHLPISAQASACKNNAQVVKDSRNAVINPGISKMQLQRTEIVMALNKLIGFEELDESMKGFNALSNFASDPLVGQLAVQRSRVKEE